MELNRPENMVEEEMSRIKRHKTAYVKSILVPVHELEDSVLWKYTVDENILSTGHVDTLLEKERPLLADLRYLHLLHVAKKLPADDIKNMKKGKKQMEPDLEQVYYPHALSILQASAQGQPDVCVLPTDYTPGDTAREDFRIYIRDMCYPSAMKVVNGLAKPLTDPSNVAAFAKLHKSILTKRLEPGSGGEFLCIFLDRINSVWVVQLVYEWKESNGTHSLSRLHVVPKIPEFPRSTQICPSLDNILEIVDDSQDVTLLDVLNSKEPSYGFRCLTRYVDTLCIMNGVPIVPVAFVTSYGYRHNMEGAHIISRSEESLIIQVRDEDEVFKVGDRKSIQTNRHYHGALGSVPNIRPMVEYGEFGNVEGVEDLGFIKLQGCDTCDSTIEWNELPDHWTAMAEALSGMHKLSVLHRDVKPENMLLISDNKLVLHGFDVSCWESEEEKLLQYVGTPQYRSPWWKKGEAFVPADDWISLGLSFVSMLSLRVCKSSLNILIKDRRTPSVMRETLDEAIYLAIVRKPEFLGCQNLYNSD